MGIQDRNVRGKIREKKEIGSGYINRERYVNCSVVFFLKARFAVFGVTCAITNRRMKIATQT